MSISVRLGYELSGAVGGPAFLAGNFFLAKLLEPADAARILFASAARFFAAAVALFASAALFFVAVAALFASAALFLAAAAAFFV